MGKNLQPQTLRKHAHIIYIFFFRCKNLKFSSENFRYFSFAQNIDCGYMLEPPGRGGSKVYPQSMFWFKDKKNRYTPVKSSFINVGYEGVYISRICYPDVMVFEQVLKVC